MHARELSLRIARQGKPTGPNDSRYNVDDMDDRDAAEIRAGKAVMLEIHLIRRDTPKSLPKVIDTVFNRVGPPDAVGNYTHPEQIIDFHLRLSATDTWANEFEELLDTVVRFRGRRYKVLSLEADDDGYSERGPLTGYAICRRIDFAPSGLPCNPKRLPLHELNSTVTTKGKTA
ncbi:hypothetical protein ABZX93_06000 [Streptomyces sp. NPDC006632]|uniref:hypothetical protein n=1 Tax=Streptomyces sp. NPDC006632 TaxID=3157182 RepID=UPI0033BDDA5D